MGRQTISICDRGGPNRYFKCVGALTKTGHCENREIDQFNQNQVKILMFSRNVLS